MKKFLAGLLLFLGAVNSFSQGVPIYSGGGGFKLNNSLNATNNQVLTWNTTSLMWVPATPPGASGGEANDGANLGTASSTVQPIFSGKSGVNLQFRSLEVDGTLTLSSNANTIIAGVTTNVYQIKDNELDALATVTAAANKIAYFTGASAATTTDFTATGASIVGAASASAARTTLGVAIGTDVQAYDADLQRLANITSASGDLIYRDATGWTNIAKGSDGQFLSLASGLPSWTSAGGNIDASNIVSGVVAVARLGSGTPDNTTYLRGDGSWVTPAGSGTVTSVGIAANPASVFDVSGTPVSSSGILTISMDNQNANLILAGPSSGGAATPAFRTIVDGDIPSTFTRDAEINTGSAFATFMGDETGSGVVVMSSAPSLTNATATALNVVGSLTNSAMTGSRLVTSSSTKVLTDALIASSIITGTVNDETGTGVLVTSSSPSITNATLAGVTITGDPTLSGLTGKSTNLYNMQQTVTIDASGNVTANSFTSTGTGGTTLDNLTVTNKITNSVLTASRLVATDTDKSLMSVTPGTGMTLSGGNLTLDTDLQRVANISGATGSIIYYDATGWTNLGVGSSGQILQLSGSTPIWATVSPGSGYATVQEEGSGLNQRATINFVGAGITATDNAGSSRTDVSMDADLNRISQASASTVGNMIVADSNGWTNITRFNLLGQISVRDYGALGDGTDQTTAIKSAYDAINKTLGGTLFFPPGQYKFNLVVTNKNIRLLGAGGFRDETSAVTNNWMSATATLPTVQIGDGTYAAHGWRIENATFYGLDGTPQDVGLRLAGGAQEGTMEKSVVWRYDTNIWVEATGTIPVECNTFRNVIVRMASGINDSRGFHIAMPSGNGSGFYTTSTTLEQCRIICGQADNTNFWGMAIGDTDVVDFGSYFDCNGYGRCILTYDATGASGSPTFAGYKTRLDDSGSVASNPIIWVSNKATKAGIMEVFTGRIMLTDGYLYGDGTAGEVSMGEGTFDMHGYYAKLLYPEIQDTMVFTLMNDATYSGIEWNHTLGRSGTNMLFGTTGNFDIHSTNGSIRFSGGISGGTTYEEKWIPASAMLPTAGTGPSLRTNTWATTTDGQVLEVLDFDGSTDESAQFTLTLPDSWDAGTVKAKVLWKALSATSGTVVWGVAGGSYSDTETAGNTLGTEITVSDGVQGTTNQVAYTAATSAITIGGTPSTGHHVWFKVFRRPTNGSDDVTTDAELIGVKLQYTKSLSSTAW